MSTTALWNSSKNTFCMLFRFDIAGVNLLLSTGKLNVHSILECVLLFDYSSIVSVQHTCMRQSYSREPLPQYTASVSSGLKMHTKIYSLV